ncbi:MAG: glycosyltransferase [Deltaproteobacteria bacterium]|nr:MAG: glycosyltransferase [Deltaproteobacteria bacterium]
MKFSVIIPAHNEEGFIERCLESIEAAAKHIAEDVEIIVSLNRCTDDTEDIARNHNAIIVKEDNKNLAKIRNAAARSASGDTIVTIDADSQMTATMLAEIEKNLSTGKYIGGGVIIRPERMSLGILMSVLTVVPVLLIHRVSGGLFWCYRRDFEAIGGFNESLVSAEDIDFAKRLKSYGKKLGKRFKTITKAQIITSCRKFDTFGDWCLFKNPRLVWKILRGHDQKAADDFYYEVDRTKSNKSPL